MCRRFLTGTDGREIFCNAANVKSFRIHQYRSFALSMYFFCKYFKQGGEKKEKSKSRYNINKLFVCSSFLPLQVWMSVGGMSDGVPVTVLLIPERKKGGWTAPSRQAECSRKAEHSSTDAQELQTLSAPSLNRLLSKPRRPEGSSPPGIYAGPPSTPCSSIPSSATRSLYDEGGRTAVPSGAAIRKTEPMRRKKRLRTARSSGIRSNCIISHRWG